MENGGRKSHFTQRAQRTQRLGGVRVHSSLGELGNRSSLAFLAHRLSGKKQWDMMLTEDFRKLWLDEKGKKSFAAEIEWVGLFFFFFFNFQVIPTFPLGPQRIKLYSFWQSWVNVFFKRKASSMYWWLILCVNLDLAMGRSDSWPNIILGISVRVILDEINI